MQRQMSLIERAKALENEGVVAVIPGLKAGAIHLRAGATNLKTGGIQTYRAKNRKSKTWKKLNKE